MKKTSIERIRHSLQMEEHVDAHVRGFRVQNVGILLILVIVGAAALGAFGDGMLSKTVIGIESEAVEFQKFYRHEARMELKVLLSNQKATMISFSNEYLKDVEIDKISPTPIRSGFNNDRTEFHFDGTGSARITFVFIPRKVGTTSGTMQVNESSFELSHFIYP